jgi:hypothetical protein
MSTKIGSIIDPLPGPTNGNIDGKSASNPTPDAGFGDAGRIDGLNNDGKFIDGIESYEPANDGGFESVESFPVSDGTGVTGRRKPGRKPGWKKPAPIDPETIRPNLAELDFASILVTCHSMLAMLTGVPELDLDKSEGVKLADGIKRVLGYHKTLGLSAQNLAYIHLAMTAGGIYGTRALAYRLRRSEERKKNGPNVTAINRPPTPPVQAAQSAQAATGTGGPTINMTGIKSPADLWSEPAQD